MGLHPWYSGLLLFFRTEQDGYHHSVMVPALVIFSEFATLPTSFYGNLC